MTTVYIFAPTRTHANTVVHTESLRDYVGGGQDINYQALTFNQTMGTRFRDGDWVLVRGLKSIGDVSRMKYFMDSLVYCAAMSDTFLILSGLDNYRAVSIRPQIIVELPKPPEKKNIFSRGKQGL